MAGWHLKICQFSVISFLIFPTSFFILFFLEVIVVINFEVSLDTDELISDQSTESTGQSIVSECRLKMLLNGI